MAMTLDQIGTLMKKQGLNYLVTPENTKIIFNMQFDQGKLYQIAILLEQEGQFMQFRTVGYSNCPESHPHIDAILKTLAAINYSARFVKLAWDHNDGEIVAYGDIWLADAKLTSDQLERMVINYLAIIDQSASRITTILETGQDPGKADPPSPSPNDSQRDALEDELIALLLEKFDGKIPDEILQSLPPAAREKVKAASAGKKKKKTKDVITRI